MIYYTDSFNSTLMVKKDNPEKNKFKTEYIKKRIYYNENNNTAYTRYNNLIFVLYKISNNLYELNYYYKNFQKGIFKKVKTEV